jgi:hypothetical protein
MISCPFFQDTPEVTGISASGVRSGVNGTPTFPKIALI